MMELEELAIKLEDNLAKIEKVENAIVERCTDRGLDPFCATVSSGAPALADILCAKSATLLAITTVKDLLL